MYIYAYEYIYIYISKFFHLGKFSNIFYFV